MPEPTPMQQLKAAIAERDAARAAPVVRASAFAFHDYADASDIDEGYLHDAEDC